MVSWSNAWITVTRTGENKQDYRFFSRLLSPHFMLSAVRVGGVHVWLARWRAPCDYCIIIMCAYNCRSLHGVVPTETIITTGAFSPHVADAWRRCCWLLIEWMSLAADDVDSRVNSPRPAEKSNHAHRCQLAHAISGPPWPYLQSRVAN